jgi:hypothetical protein
MVVGERLPLLGRGAEFGEGGADWVFTVALATCIVAAISPLVAPHAISCRTSCSGSVSDATFVA